MPSPFFRPTLYSTFFMRCLCISASQVLTLSALRDGVTAAVPSEWLRLGDGGPGGAATTSTVPQDSKGSDPATQGGQSAQRVYLGVKLAGRPGAWEESAPEDLLPTLRFSASLAVAVLHSVSSRVKARCQPAVAALRGNTARTLALLSQFEPTAENDQRSVYPAVIAALRGCLQYLLAPAVFCAAGATATQTAALLLSTLSGAPNPGAVLTTDVLATTAGNFDEEVSAAVLGTFLASKVRIKCNLVYPSFTRALSLSHFPTLVPRNRAPTRCACWWSTAATPS
jgi:hypothetical protein